MRRLSGSALCWPFAPACRLLMRRSPLASPPPRKSAAPAQSEQFVDGIAAVVDKDVITRELHEASLRIAGDLKRAASRCLTETLQHQVLQRLIMERVQRHEADRMGIRVDDAQVDQATQAIAARNKIGVDQLRKEIEKSGVSWDSYRKSLRDEIRMDRLRQRAVDSNIVISDAEVDAFLRDQRRNPAFAAQTQAEPQPQPQAQPEPAPEQAAPSGRCCMRSRRSWCVCLKVHRLSS